MSLMSEIPLSGSRCKSRPSCRTRPARCTRRFPPATKKPNYFAFTRVFLLMYRESATLREELPIRGTNNSPKVKQMAPSTARGPSCLMSLARCTRRFPPATNKPNYFALYSRFLLFVPRVGNLTKEVVDSRYTQFTKSQTDGPIDGASALFSEESHAMYASISTSRNPSC